GFIFQAYNLLPVLTAQENVELPLLLAGVSESEAHPLALDALKMVGLTEWKSHKPMELSGGQRQRVTIARALVNKPAIVWADEPTGALDSEAAQDILDLLGRLNAEIGQTLVMVTHAPEVGERANRIVRMRDGQIEDAGLGKGDPSGMVQGLGAVAVRAVLRDENLAAGGLLSGGSAADRLRLFKYAGSRTSASGPPESGDRGPHLQPRRR